MLLAARFYARKAATPLFVESVRLDVTHRFTDACRVPVLPTDYRRSHRPVHTRIFYCRVAEERRYRFVGRAASRPSRLPSCTSAERWQTAYHASQRIPQDAREHRLVSDVAARRWICSVKSRSVECRPGGQVILRCARYKRACPSFV